MARKQYRDRPSPENARSVPGENRSPMIGMQDNPLLSAIVNASDDAILSKTLDGMITSWNPAAQRMFGYTADEIIGQAKTILFPPDRLHEEEVILDRLRRGISTENFETVCLRKDGTSISVSVTISPIKNGDGQVIGASTIARDISERNRIQEALRESETLYRTLGEAAPNFVWSADATG